ncbi:MAG: MORN repeat-containing protein [Bacteroidia bacterium]
MEIITKVNGEVPNVMVQVFTRPLRDEYKGEWRNDEMHGQGQYSYRNEDV